MSRSLAIDTALYLPRLSFADKASCLRELTRLLLDGHGYSHEVVELVWHDMLRREELGTTGIGRSIAAPHSKCVRELVGAYFGWFSLEPPLDFDSLDGEPVSVIFCSVMGADYYPGTWLRVLELVVRTIRNPEIVNAIRSANDAAEMKAVLTASSPGW